MTTVKQKITFYILVLSIVIMFVILVGDLKNFENKKATFVNGNDGLGTNGPIVLVIPTPYPQPVSKPFSNPNRTIYIKTVANDVLTIPKTVVPSRVMRAHARSYKVGTKTSHKRLHTHKH